MWNRERRKFWFYDQYVVFMAQSNASVERTRERLDLALDRWKSGTGDIIYSGSWGWYDPQSGRFERDPLKNSFPEEWEEPKRPGLGSGWDRMFAKMKEDMKRLISTDPNDESKR